jgi:hypothetical protein
MRFFSDAYLRIGFRTLPLPFLGGQGYETRASYFHIGEINQRAKGGSV